MLLLIPPSVPLFPLFLPLLAISLIPSPILSNSAPSDFFHSFGSQNQCTKFVRYPILPICLPIPLAYTVEMGHSLPLLPGWTHSLLPRVLRTFSNQFFRFLVAACTSFDCRNVEARYDLVRLERELQPILAQQV